MLVPGVGKRTAQRLLVELKARLDVPDLDLADGGGGAPSRRAADVRDALAGLGYGPTRSATCSAQLADDGDASKTCCATRCELLAVSA